MAELTVIGTIAGRGPARARWRDGILNIDPPAAYSAVAFVLAAGRRVSIAGVGSWEPTIAPDAHPDAVLATLAAAFDTVEAAERKPPRPDIPADAIP